MASDRSKSSGTRSHPAHVHPREWRELRRAYIADVGVCAACGSTSGPWDLDHVVPITDGGEWWGANLQLLCRPCHIEKTRRERERPNPERDEWREFLEGWFG